MPQSDTFAFGPFQLDLRTKRLLDEGAPVALSARHFDLLGALVTRAGEVLSKDQLIQIGWRDVAVSDNSIEQAISVLRRLLRSTRPDEYIATEARRGYRFSAPVTRLVPRESDAALDALLAPHRAWIEGRALLETLERDQIAQARDVFEDVLRRAPEQAPVHVGLANAYGLQFETTRADEAPDVAALERAAHHAREACRLDAQYGEAWATLGFVLDRVGRHADALAAVRRAVTLEPDNWRHHVRLAYTAWGEERLRAADRTLTLLPGFPMAHWLAATVHIARGSLSEAERALDAGIAAQEVEGARPIRFSSVALHWLRGAIYLARGDEKEAVQEFIRELTAESSGHLYARECAANTWYAVGALELWRGRVDEARAAFDQALSRVAIHPMARAGLEIAAADRTGAVHTAASMADTSPGRTSVIDTAMAEAARILFAGADRAAAVARDSARAAAIVESALARSAVPSAGWLLPLEPLLRVGAAPDAWATALALLRARAA